MKTTHVPISGSRRRVFIFSTLGLLRGVRDRVPAEGAGTFFQMAYELAPRTQRVKKSMPLRGAEVKSSIASRRAQTRAVERQIRASTAKQPLTPICRRERARIRKSRNLDEAILPPAREYERDSAEKKPGGRSNRRSPERPQRPRISADPPPLRPEQGVSAGHAPSDEENRTQFEARSDRQDSGSLPAKVREAWQKPLQRGGRSSPISNRRRHQKRVDSESPTDAHRRPLDSRPLLKTKKLQAKRGRRVRAAGRADNSSLHPVDDLDPSTTRSRRSSAASPRPSARSKTPSSVSPRPTPKPTRASTRRT